MDALESMKRVYAACLDLSTRETLDALQLTWMAVASNARNEALRLPDGFPTERARQVEKLRRLAAIVEADVPDLEVERLFQEGNIDGWLRLVQQRLVTRPEEQHDGLASRQKATMSDDEVPPSPGEQ